jgi:hypothetical protein
VNPSVSPSWSASKRAAASGGRDVVVEVGDEGDFLADDLRSTPVGGLEDPLFPARVDPGGVSPRR